MNTRFNFSLAASAVLIFCGAAAAGGPVLLAVNSTVKPVTEITVAELKAAPTEAVKTVCSDTRDFDALSAVNDPFYREGSKEFLKEVSGLNAPEPAVKTDKQALPALRDAPNSGVQPAVTRPEPLRAPPALKKPKIKKIGPADPLNVKNTL